MSVRVIDITDAASFGRLPPCADRRFDHRTCDYWEDDARGSKAHRASWLADGAAPTPPAANRLGNNPFAPTSGPAFNPFARGSTAAPGSTGPGGAAAPAGGTGARASERPLRDLFGDADETPIENPFAPPPPVRPRVGADAPRKLQLLGRGLGVFGSYAKVLELDGQVMAYCQFGPLSAYPRAQRVRELYPRLPAAPLPAVITCIATTAEGRGQGLARRLVSAVADDLATRGFSAVEAYPEPEAEPDATSAAHPGFWLACGFDLAIDDPRFPVVRREL
ncbi:MAG TPA: GNAT family N-acetyltransferase [Candidatus Limnocylindrales bacterium]